MNTKYLISNSNKRNFEKLMFYYFYICSEIKCKDYVKTVSNLLN